MYLVNQLVKFNNDLGKFLKEKEIEVSLKHKEKVRQCEILIVAVFVLTLLIPTGITFVLLHPLEPTHVLLKEWMDFEFTLKPLHLPFLIPFWMAVFGATTLIFILTALISIYSVLTTIALDGIIPEQVDHIPVQSRNCTIVTRAFGTMEDAEIIPQMYRTQQILNNLATDIFGSVKVAFHHVTCIVTFSVLVCFSIKFQEFFAANGVVAYVIVVAYVLVPVLIIYCQSEMCGELVGISENFRQTTGRKLRLSREMVLRMFVGSCRSLYS